MRIHSKLDELFGAESVAKGGGPGEHRSAEVVDGLPEHGVSHRDLLRIFHGGQPMVTRDASRTPLTDARRQVIRQRLRDGSYASPDAMDVLARALLDSGALHG